MKTPTPPLLPLLRSRVQADLLALVLLSPGREWTLTELAAHAAVPLASAQREVTRAEQAGIVTSRRLGPVRLIAADPRSPLTEPLTELLLRSFGPRQVLAAALDGLPGIESAWIYGSWAARYAGEPGRAPADLDVLVIGSPDRGALADILDQAEHRLAREVNVTIRSPQWWDEDGSEDPLRTHIRQRPLVQILPGAPS